MNNNAYIVGAKKPDGIEPTISQERLEEIKKINNTFNNYKNMPPEELWQLLFESIIDCCIPPIFLKNF